MTPRYPERWFAVYIAALSGSAAHLAETTNCYDGLVKRAAERCCELAALVANVDAESYENVMRAIELDMKRSKNEA